MFYGGGYMIGMHLWWWAFWLLVVVVALLALTRGRGEGPASPHETPHDILRRRLAAGEISAQEFKELEALLHGERK